MTQEEKLAYGAKLIQIGNEMIAEAESTTKSFYRPCHTYAEAEGFLGKYIMVDGNEKPSQIIGIEVRKQYGLQPLFFNVEPQGCINAIAMCERAVYKNKPVGVKVTQ